MVTWLANPARFRAFARVLVPCAAMLAVVLLSAGGLAAFSAPPDYQQGYSVRIMYVHVPSAWLSLFVYSAMAVAALCGRVWKHTLADLFARSAAPVGAAFTFICLVTGSLWGKPMWGTWWVWDARLTSVLILFFFYMGYIALCSAFDDEEKGLNAGGYLLLAGFINVPVVKFSVDWWNTLHQSASVARFARPAIDPAILKPLLLMAGGLFALAVVLLCLRLETAMLNRRARAREMGV